MWTVWKESINNKLDCDTKPTTTDTTNNQQQTRLDLQGVDHALMLRVHYPWLDTSIRCLVVGILIGTRWNWLKHMCKVSEYKYDNRHTLACPFRKNMYVHVYTYMYICYRHVKQRPRSTSTIYLYNVYVNIYKYAPYHLCNLLAVDDALHKLDTDDHQINFQSLLDIVSVKC